MEPSFGTSARRVAPIKVPMPPAPEPGPKRLIVRLSVALGRRPGCHRRGGSRSVAPTPGGGWRTDRFHPVRTNAGGRRVVPPPHAAGGRRWDSRPSPFTRFSFHRFREGAGAGGLGSHLAHEWVTAREPARACCWASRCCPSISRRAAFPPCCPRYLPDDWKGGFVLLVMIFVLSSFLDNIAAALIGGTIANVCSAARCTSATWRRSSRRRTPAARAASSATRRRR